MEPPDDGQPIDPEATKTQPERDQTDENLRTERKNTDQTVARRLAFDGAADEVVDRARNRADAVLDAARDKADQDLQGPGPGPQRRDAVAAERAVQDEVLHDERAAADESLHRERQELARTLAVLLPLEREKTDRSLLLERSRSDAAIAHRDDFLGMVSHDLRNLLAAIFLDATRIADEASESEEGRRTVAGIKRLQRYVARMNGLIADLVDVVSIDAGKLAMQPQPCDAGDVAEEALEAFSRAAAEKGIALTSAIPAPFPLVRFDRERILRVLANLISNALKFTPRGGRVLLRREDDEAGLHLSVNDTGTGIPANMLEAIFERFWQVGNHDRRGLGLGLYISKSIIAAHGGKIWAESELGKGTSLHFTIPGPVVPADASRATAAPQPTAAARPCHILVVDNDQVVLALLAQLLERGGHQVRCADNAAEALELAERPEPLDLLIADVHLVGSTGPDIGALLSLQRPDLPVLFISGDPVALEEASGGGRRGTLLKPFRGAELLEQVAIATAPGAGAPRRQA